MGKLIVNEQDVKRILGEETNGEHGLIGQYVNKELLATNARVQIDIQNIERKYDEKNKDIDDRITMLLERIVNLEKQKTETDDVVVSNHQILEVKDDDILEIDVLSKKLNISGLDAVKIKYFLYEKGIYDVKINEFRDSYSLKSDFGNEVDKELVSYIHTDGKKTTFDKDIIDYFIKNKNDVLTSIARHNSKKKQYNISRKNVVAKQVQNYRDEIKNICGTDSPTRWIEIYKEFSKTFPSFYDDHKKYAKKYAEKYPNAKHEFSKLGYVVEVMQQGNVLLKIACHLYVN